jgi:hypothetical protein
MTLEELDAIRARCEQAERIVRKVTHCDGCGETEEPHS